MTLGDKPRKDDLMQIRLTRDLKKLIEAAASACDLDVSSWVRTTLSREARRLLK